MLSDIWNFLRKANKTAWRNLPDAGNQGASTEGSVSTADVDISQVIDEFAGGGRVAQLPTYMMPIFQGRKDFCGRDDILKVLDKNLLPPKVSKADTAAKSEHLQCVAICGTGGIGKTEIALQFVSSRKDEFDAVFWIQADTIEKVESDFSQIPVHLKLEDSDEQRNLVVSREIAKGWLSNPVKLAQGTESNSSRLMEATWLLVFDNGDDPDILTDFTHMLGSGSVLITSRHPYSKEIFSPTTVGIDLQPLSETDGATLLGRIATTSRTKRQPELANRVAQRLAGHPLAIVQMAGIIRQQFLSYSEFLVTYEDHAEHEHFLLQDISPQRDTARRSSASRESLASTWAFDKLKPEAQYVLEIVSFLDPDCIQEKSLLECLPKLWKDQGHARGKGSFYAARGELMGASLIRRNDDTEEWWLHRVLQDAVRARLNATETLLRFKAAVTITLSAWPNLSPAEKHSIRRWQQCQKTYPHVSFLRDIYIRHEEWRHIQEFEEFAILLNEAAW